MVKKLVYLEAEQDRHVKQLAREAGTSETEIIRRAVEAYWESETAHVFPDGWPDDPTDWFKG